MFAFTKMNDKELIKALGGARKVAEHLGYEGKKGACRVGMWMKRGIPPRVRLENLGYFQVPIARPEKDEKPRE